MVMTKNEEWSRHLKLYFKKFKLQNYKFWSDENKFFKHFKDDKH